MVKRLDKHGIRRAAAATLAALLATCGPVSDDPNNVPEDAEVHDSREFDDDVGEKSHRYLYLRRIYPGRSVQVWVTVDDVLAHNLFRIVGRASGRPDVLVVHDSEAPLAQGQFLRVAGDVIRLTRDARRKALKAGLTQRQFRMHEGDLAIVAEDVERV